MIKVTGNLFVLETCNTSYCFEKTVSGHLEHLYYGRKINLDEKNVSALREKNAFVPGCSLAYDKDFSDVCLEDMKLEMSGYGKGDIRAPFVEIAHEDGSRTCDFVYYESKVIDESLDDGTLPRAYNESGDYEHLVIALKDRNYKMTLELHYLVYEDSDVITRYSRLVNDGEEAVRLFRLMSAQVDFARDSYEILTFNGAWTREMERHSVSFDAGCFINSSVCGVSSNRANPFVILSKKGTDEQFGDCFGFNLLYSGNHAEIFDFSAFGKLRFLNGINPAGFEYVIDGGEEFVSPEAVLSYSPCGFNGLSANMHNFVREHILKGTWKKKTRPVLLNSWEAAYFKINEKKLVELAKEAKNIGIELIVLDDGWFGERNDDTSSLGDWFVNTKKFPGGLKGVADKIKALGLDFGIWVEPEMINVKSKLYKAHPEYAMDIPGKAHTEGRNQRVLDLTRDDVCDFVIESMTDVFGSADISYVKWDMNRIFSDVFSASLPSNRQGEVAHRYMLGLYRILRTLNERFPEILFEGCSSGGNRFDLGALCYFSQIWASDDTDAYQRAFIQNGYSYGYPMNTVTAHVSNCPNHQTLRKTPLDTRFNVAFFSNLGYEYNLCEMKQKDKDELKEQIKLYKKWRDVISSGTFYRSKSFSDSNNTVWTCVSKDKTRAVALDLQNRVTPNTTFRHYEALGLDRELKYHFYNIDKSVDIREFGDLVNMISPVALKQDSVMMDIAAKFVKLDGEKEDYHLSGEFLMDAGVNLKPNFAGTGFNDQAAFFQDMASRLYFMEAE